MSRQMELTDLRERVVLCKRCIARVSECLTPMKRATL